MSKQRWNQQGWKVVGQAEVEKATRKKTARQKEVIAAIEALTKLKADEAIRIPFPEDCSKRGNLRCWWRDKMLSVSTREQSTGFMSMTSSDGKFLFIQRKPEGT